MLSAAETVRDRCPTGEQIPIEERGDEEVRWIDGVTPQGRPERIRISPEGTAVRNWAFDVTPAEYVTGVVTERGVVSADARAIEKVMHAPTPVGSR